MSGHVLDGTFLSLDPTEFGWVPRQRLGEDGYGNAVYVQVREYYMKWGLMNATQYNEIQQIFEGARDERVVCTLANFAETPYGFANYSGCVIDEPDFNRWFTEHYQNVEIRIRNIQT